MVRLSPEQERGRHEEGPDRHHRLPDAHREPRAHADRCPRRRISWRGGWRGRPPSAPRRPALPWGPLRPPPLPPPPPPPPALPPAPPSPPGGRRPPPRPASGSPAPERHSQVYRWTDGQGVTHLTDRWDAVPPEYRARATRFQPS